MAASGRMVAKAEREQGKHLQSDQWRERTCTCTSYFVALTCIWHTSLLRQNYPYFSLSPLCGSSNKWYAFSVLESNRISCSSLDAIFFVSVYASKFVPMIANRPQPSQPTVTPRPQPMPCPTQSPSCSLTCMPARTRSTSTSLLCGHLLQQRFISFDVYNSRSSSAICIEPKEHIIF